jgi:hypothetical protein
MGDGRFPPPGVGRLFFWGKNSITKMLILPLFPPALFKLAGPEEVAVGSYWGDAGPMVWVEWTYAIKAIWQK